MSATCTNPEKHAETFILFHKQRKKKHSHFAIPKPNPTPAQLFSQPLLQKLISTAIVLLVIALRKICNCQKPLLGPNSEEIAYRFTFGLMNVDVISGLDYYAQATDIFGNCHGGNNLAHIQANLLSRLYASQLARAFESWSWIHTGSRTCQYLF